MVKIMQMPQGYTNERKPDAGEIRQPNLDNSNSAEVIDMAERRLKWNLTTGSEAPSQPELIDTSEEEERAKEIVFQAGYMVTGIGRPGALADGRVPDSHEYALTS